MNWTRKRVALKPWGWTKRWIAVCWAAGLPGLAGAGALEDYVARPDTNYSWRRIEPGPVQEPDVVQLELVSQQWRESVWTHRLLVVRPEKVRNPDIAFLLIGGDGSGNSQLPILRTLAARAGALTAVLTRVPNQPLYDGRKEDALISFTFLQYLDTGDETWPALFPMVKSAVRGMDTVQAFAAEEHRQKIAGFVVGGASKRGWTTWLTAAVDRRVKAIAPMVIDMLNMKAQLKWSQQVYGRQSEKIHDYTELKLHERMDEPGMVRLRGWVDPYSYRERYTMPKLLLLGSNDPYWTVDSLRHYWNELPGPKLVFQTPNAGHDLAGGREALPTLAAFFQLVADRQPLPKVDWEIGDSTNGTARVKVKVDGPVTGIRLWTASSVDRDFRNDQWTSADLEVKSGSSQATGVVETPQTGYQAYLAEVALKTSDGRQYKLSTEARVTPDTLK